MPKGQTFPPEKRRFTDPETGHTVWQLTQAPGHDHHLYFTETSFLPDGRHLVFSSDRGGKFDHYLLALATGAFSQLTDVTGRLNSLSSVIDPRGDWLYFWEGPDLKALHFQTLKERPLYRSPEGWRGGLLSISADGVHLAFALIPILELKSETARIYSGMDEMFERCTATDIVVVRTDGSGHHVACHETCWVSHVNVCPSDRDLILYCHEGRWERVAQRMWLVRADGTGRRALRPQQPEDALGHEYWLADGLTVGYHGRRGPQKEGIFGLIAKDGANCREYVLPAPCNHCQSTHDGRRHVTDGLGGQRYIWEIHPQADGHPRCPERVPARSGRGEDLPHAVGVTGREAAARGAEPQWGGPQADGTATCTKVVKHDGSFDMQIGHPHPGISPDDRWVLYTSDRGGHCNVYLPEL
jgi:oligogalacturonide lyase